MNAFFVFPRALLAESDIKMLNWLLMTLASQDATIMPQPADRGRTVRRMQPVKGTTHSASTTRFLLSGNFQHPATPIQMKMICTAPEGDPYRSVSALVYPCVCVGF